MTDEITATKSELASDLMSVLKMNKELMELSRETQGRIDRAANLELLAFQMGRAKELRIQLNGVKQDINRLKDKL
jgi:uncharacterized alpha-E superfamily protein